MKRVVQFVTYLMLFGFASGQELSNKISDAVRKLESDNQMKSALFGLYVVDQSSGSVVFERNSSVGFMFASSQKVITSISAFELLGNEFRYETSLGYDGKITGGSLLGNVYITGSGDPTLGSWRYDNTKEQVVFNKWIDAIKQAGIRQIGGNIIADNNNWETQTIPGGWIWDDIGNYYGAGVAGVNWRENQYDLKLRSGHKAGDKTTIVATEPRLYGMQLNNEVATGKAGSGDNAYIYLPPYATTGYIRGTVPPNESAFTISGSFPDPSKQCTQLFADELRKQGIEVSKNIDAKWQPSKIITLATHLSPPLDSMNYWFLRKSINLYGEAFVKTIGREKRQEAATDAGLHIIKSFWSRNGIDTTSIKMVDGSGLSPVNRVAPAALGRIMQYARSKPWFSSFYNALPLYNGIKMKSGTIGGAKSFTGYVNGYTFAIVVNNYNGSTAEIVRKIYRVLDVLK